jgi:trimeric autotransporter adhesin
MRICIKLVFARNLYKPELLILDGAICVSAIAALPASHIYSHHGATCTTTQATAALTAVEEEALRSTPSLTEHSAVRAASAAAREAVNKAAAAVQSSRGHAAAAAPVQASLSTAHSTLQALRAALRAAAAAEQAAAAAAAAAAERAQDAAVRSGAQPRLGRAAAAVAPPPSAAAAGGLAARQAAEALHARLQQLLALCEEEVREVLCKHCCEVSPVAAAVCC